MTLYKTFTKDFITKSKKGNSVPYKLLLQCFLDSDLEEMQRNMESVKSMVCYAATVSLQAGDSVYRAIEENTLEILSLFKICLAVL